MSSLDNPSKTKRLDSRTLDESNKIHPFTTKVPPGATPNGTIRLIIFRVKGLSTEI